MRSSLLQAYPHAQCHLFQEKEVKMAVDKGKCNKSVGADMVPQELLRAIADNAVGIKGLTEFFNELLCQQTLPDKWQQSILTLLSKMDVPHHASQLRPVALTSHIYKTFSRLVLQRISARLMLQGPEQTSCPGRQAADFLWCLQNVAQLSLEWGSGLVMAKLDVSRAFDSLNRRVLASIPWEVSMIIRMLQAEVHVIPTVWGEASYLAGSGVKQGAVESPWIFSWVMSLIMTKVRDPAEEHTNWLAGAPLARVVYMDDLVGWSARTETLQKHLLKVQAEMEKWVLKVNLGKSAMICFGDVGVKKIQLRGQELLAQEENTPLMVMGLPTGPGSPVRTSWRCCVKGPGVGSDRGGKFFTLGRALAKGTES